MNQIEAIKTALQNHYVKSEKRGMVISRASESLIDNHNGANTRKMLRDTMLVLRDQMELNQLLIQAINLLAPEKKSNKDSFDTIDKLFGGGFR